LITKLFDFKTDLENAREKLIFYLHSENYLHYIIKITSAILEAESGVYFGVNIPTS